jgi:hypothetical protein
VQVLIEDADGAGRAAHQGPEVDGATTVIGAAKPLEIGQFVWADVIETDGIDLVAQISAD